MTVEGTPMPQPYQPVAQHPPAPHPLAPPAGPGVQPPFLAPPTDGARQRRWLAIGLAGGTALVLCVGGLFGLGGLIVFGNQMVLDQSRAAVTDYLTAVKDHDYDAAYAQLCPAERARTSKILFERTWQADPEISSFSVADPVLTGNTMVVPATIAFGNGSTRTVRYAMQQDSGTGDFEVCGEEG